MQRRNAIAARYLDAFNGHPHVVSPMVREGAVHAWHRSWSKLKTDEFMAHMAGHAVSTGIHYPIPCHLQPVFAAHPQADDPGLRGTADPCDRIVSLPVFPFSKMKRWIAPSMPCWPTTVPLEEGMPSATSLVV